MDWVYSTAFGVALLVKIKGVTNDKMYRDILRNNISGEYVDNLPLRGYFSKTSTRNIAAI